MTKELFRHNNIRTYIHPAPLTSTPPLRGVGSRTSQRDNKISAGPLRSLRLCVRIVMPHGLSVFSVISV